MTSEATERIKNALREAFSETSPAPPPPLAADMRLRGKSVSLPKAFRISLGFHGPTKLQATVHLTELELRLGLPCLLSPSGGPEAMIKSDSPLMPGDAISEAFRQFREEMDEWTLITEACLNKRGHVALDTRAQHRLGWQNGDRVRVVLEEDHLRLIRIA